MPRTWQRMNFFSLPSGQAWRRVCHRGGTSLRFLRPLSRICHTLPTESCRLWLGYAFLDEWLRSSRQTCHRGHRTKPQFLQEVNSTVGSWRFHVKVSLLCLSPSLRLPKLRWIKTFAKSSPASVQCTWCIIVCNHPRETFPFTSPSPHLITWGSNRQVFGVDHSIKASHGDTIPGAFAQVGANTHLGISNTSSKRSSR